MFPNRRAILFFRKHLGTLLKKPAFAPTMLTIEEYIKSFSTLQVPDKLELVHWLYKAYTETVKSNESFDRFYYWGEMLLHDFEELTNASSMLKCCFRLSTEGGVGCQLRLPHRRTEEISA